MNTSNQFLNLTLQTTEQSLRMVHALAPDTRTTDPINLITADAMLQASELITHCRTYLGSNNRKAAAALQLAVLKLNANAFYVATDLAAQEADAFNLMREETVNTLLTVQATIEKLPITTKGAASYA